jgi:predicted methyltransferase
MRILLAAALALSLAAAPAFSSPVPPAIAKALADPGRPQSARDADASRLPGETLAFAGVRPGMTVIELYPGGGYFTRPLSELVGDKGRVVAVETTRWKGGVEADQKMLAELPRQNVTLEALPFGALPAKAPPADLFWITQNYHDLKIAEYGAVDMAAFNRRVFELLKPGGVYFILDHQANGTLTPDQIAKLHRIDKATVIREVEAAGFKLADEGRFLARPTDDHTAGIFDKAIQGKTDQYALKFVKPKS